MTAAMIPISIFPSRPTCVNAFACSACFSCSSSRALADQGQCQGAQAEMCHWPARDTWLDERLRAAGLEPFLQRSVRSTAPLSPASRPAPADARVRLAVPEDEETLVALYLEE